MVVMVMVMVMVMMMMMMMATMMRVLVVLEDAVPDLVGAILVGNLEVDEAVDDLLDDLLACIGVRLALQDLLEGGALAVAHLRELLEAPAVHRVGDGAVSYTHLTLPTILLV
eukprot:1825788-Pyramimonas_sp.AAC.1